MFVVGSKLDPVKLSKSLPKISLSAELPSGTKLLGFSLNPGDLVKKAKDLKLLHQESTILKSSSCRKIKNVTDQE